MVGTMRGRHEYSVTSRSKNRGQRNLVTAVKQAGEIAASQAQGPAEVADGNASMQPGSRNRKWQSGFISNSAGVLRERNFRRFYTGYVTSLFGTSMSSVALAFAVLDGGGNAADLGYVFAAGVVPQVLFMLGGGVIADRLGRRPVMLAADAVRFTVQATLAAALLAGSPPIWLFVVLEALLGTGEAFFTPALGALTPDIAPPRRLSDANALLGLAQSVTRITGPAVAGILVAATMPGVVIALDAASYGASVLALSLLRLPARKAPLRSPLRDLADGWSKFRSLTWLWVTTVQYALFNLFTWAPYLLLGPVLSKDYLGGARAWGLILTAQAAGAILAGTLLVGRRPRRPVVAAVIGAFGYPMPCLLLALHAPVWGVAAGALAAGVGSAVSNTFWTTALQQQVPPEMLARAMAFSLTGSFALGSAAFTVIGPIAAVAGAGTVLGVAAAWGILSPAVVLAVPAVWSVAWRPGG
jgi:Transmembrane secretion effector